MKLTSDPDISEDLTQETFFKVLSRIKDYKGDCKFYTWVCSIAKNSYYDLVRKQRKRNHLSFDDGSLFNMISPSPEEKAVDSDLAARVHEALHSLDEPYREVFWMRAYGELSFSRIAELHGKSESWARVTYYRARLMIKEAIE